MIAISWGPPSSKQRAACLASARQGDFNYDGKYVGSTHKASLKDEEQSRLQSDGYAVNMARVQLGKGEPTFLKGKEQLKNWRHFQLPWALVDPNIPIKPGQRFCVCVNEFFLWVLTPLEVLYVNDTHSIEYSLRLPNLSVQQQNVPRDTLKGIFSYGSGTLKGHLLAGEEVFSIKWEEDDTVWYEILSFSKPAKFLSKATYPYVQWRQRLFAGESTDAMLRAVKDM